MEQITHKSQFKIYNHGKLDKKNEIRKEVSFVASVFAEAGRDIARAIVDDFRS
jgi:hypothetical protein